MTTLLLSDIHGNLDALEAVLRHARGVEAVWFLGDAVGYGPEPAACVRRLIALEPECWLAGNHDWAAVGRIDTADFNLDARRAVEWTGEQLDDVTRARLLAVEPRLDVPGGEVTLAHGSPRHPIWEYILDAVTALENFGHFESPVCFFGHTHVPVVYEDGFDGTVRRSALVEEPVNLDGVRALVNPGSVGQPRDGDPRASYALFDRAARTVTFHRVAYDIGAVQAKILTAGLPARLAARLEYGW